MGDLTLYIKDTYSLIFKQHSHNINLTLKTQPTVFKYFTYKDLTLEY